MAESCKSSSFDEGSSMSQSDILTKYTFFQVQTNNFTDSSSTTTSSLDLESGIKDYESICTSDQESLHSCRCSRCDADQTTNFDFTLAIVKPEAMIYRKEIERDIVDSGFVIIHTRWLKLTPEQASEFYQDNYESKDFPRLVAYMSSKPILVMAIAKKNAVDEWKTLAGPCKVSEAKIYAPDSVRGRYGFKSNNKDDETRNVVHASCNEEAAKREIKFFFPEFNLSIATSKKEEEAGIEYLQKEINELLMKSLIKCCEEKPEDPVKWLGNWLLENASHAPRYQRYNPDPRD